MEQEAVETISIVSESIGGELQCKKENVANISACLDGFIPEIDYVYIEGHTDNKPFRARNGIRDNIDLSLLRAASVKRILDTFISSKTSKVFIPVGYGSTKPIVYHQTPTKPQKSENWFSLFPHKALGARRVKLGS